MERLPTFRSRLVRASALLCALLLQIIAGIMCVPSDLAPEGTMIGVLVAQERTLLPWLLMGINAVVMYIFILDNHYTGIIISAVLSLVHGASFAIVFYAVNIYPSADVMAIPFFAIVYWVFVGSIWVCHRFIVFLYRLKR